MGVLLEAQNSQRRDHYDRIINSRSGRTGVYHNIGFSDTIFRLIEDADQSPGSAGSDQRFCSLTNPLDCQMPRPVGLLDPQWYANL